MAGENVPLVMLPRYTTLCGEWSGGGLGFTTIAMDVSDYTTAILNVWRGRMEYVPITSETTIKFTAEESTDQRTWSTCAGTNCSAYDPTYDVEGQVTATLGKRWFRIRVELTALGSPTVPFPRATCWAVGFLIRRKV